MAKELAKYGDISNYPALRSDGMNLAELIETNLQGASLTPFSLDRIKVPSGGATVWMVPDLDEGERAEKFITGIVVYNQFSRAYWRVKFGQGESGPPDCQSMDNIIGSGNPGGSCKDCPFNAWGSAVDQSGNPTRGKACQERRFLFMLRPDNLLPVVIQTPTTSMASFNSFVLRLISEGGTQLHHVILELGLVRRDVGGFPVATITPKLVSRLSDEDMQRVDGVRQELLPVFQQKVAQAEFLND